MLSSRSILQVKLKYWITQWSWSLGMVHIWNWFGLLPGGNRPGWPCHWRYGGSSRYKRALLFQLGQSCPDYETLQIKLESVSHVCKIYVIIDTGWQPIYKKGTGLVQLEWMGEQICSLRGTITVWIDWLSETLVFRRTPETCEGLNRGHSGQLLKASVGAQGVFAGDSSRNSMEDYTQPRKWPPLFPS